MASRTTPPVPTDPGSSDSPRSVLDEPATLSGVGSDDPLWYKDAVIYELHVRSFHDSDGDGVGDFRGLTRKLDYLQELGVTALWLLPFYPSPLRDDGYDIADYRSINPAYGTMEDFQTFLREAHRRDLRVITELVINHTSDQHPWFQRARRAPEGSDEREYYVWSDDPDRYRETRVIFKDFEPSNWTWDPVAEQWFWHRFYHHQPDLNFDNPLVHEELFSILDYWFEMGVDGLRLDAIPYLYEREGTNCENLDETHAFLKKLRAHVDERFENRLLLAEANQWPEDAAAYFGEGDECHMNFHFPIMPRLFMALRMEDRFPIVDILEQTPKIPDTCQWAIFLRNHDELTLEMVTDEERDYMYRVYAHDRKARINLGIRRRLSPLLENNRNKIELMKSLLFALPGTPVLYYGDEIGMGDNFYLGDRNGVRTPMQWTGDRNAGFSTANPQKLFLPVIIDPEYHYESVNVEAQEHNPSSLLWWTRRMIALRKQLRVFGRGSVRWLDSGNKRVMAFVREHEDESVLVVANLSRFSQAVDLDLEDFAGQELVELFGRTPFPPIREDDPYRLTLGPHNFFWFLMEPEGSRDAIEVLDASARDRERLPRLRATGVWTALLEPERRGRLERLLLQWLPTRRWFAGKGRAVRKGEILDVVLLPGRSTKDGSHHPDGGATGPDAPASALLLFRVEYVAEDPETYLIPLAFSHGEGADAIWERHRTAVLARLDLDGGEGLVHDAVVDREFSLRLLEVIGSQTALGGESGRIRGISEHSAEEILGPELEEPPEPNPGRAEQTNTSTLYGDRWILKLLRRVEAGTNLDREVGSFLTTLGFPNTPDVAGALEYRVGREEAATLGVLQRYVPNHGDAWSYTLDALGRYFERARAHSDRPDALPMPVGLAGDEVRWPDNGGRDAREKPTGSAESPSGAAKGEEGRITEELDVPEAVHRLVDEPFLEAARLLGRRTGEMHRALSSERADPAFRPEPFGRLYQRSLYQSMRNLLGQTFRTLSERIPSLGEDDREKARRLLEARSRALGRFGALLDRKLDGSRIRVHGDYHLGQVLYTGPDFVIIDFEGEPARPLSERRLKRSPMRDVAGMLRSFDYAAHVAAFDLRDRGLGGTREAELGGWARFWVAWTSVVFMRGYLDAMADTDTLPSNARARELLMESFLLEKALYELSYELNNRPSWAGVPLDGLLRLLELDRDTDRDGRAAEP